MTEERAQAFVTPWWSIAIPVVAIMAWVAWGVGGWEVLTGYLLMLSAVYVAGALASWWTFLGHPASLR